ncbi:MAG: AAA family ATPase [Candidatus Pacearchaeota archaeon]
MEKKKHEKKPKQPKKLPEKLVKLVIGIIGTIASGKGTVTSYLVKKHKFKRIVMGNLVRAIARSEGIAPTRENLHNLQARYRAKDPGYFIKKAIAKIKASKHNKWVVDGLRNPEDAHLLKKAFNAKIIFVDAPIALRWERARKRRRGKEKEISLDEFKKIENEENKIFHFNITKRYADFKLMNNTTKEDLWKNTEKILKKLKHQSIRLD